MSSGRGSKAPVGRRRPHAGPTLASDGEERTEMSGRGHQRGTGVALVFDGGLSLLRGGTTGRVVLGIAARQPRACDAVSCPGR